MAIRVKTGIVEQQKADASVFGYNQVYQSSASAVANALDRTAQAAGNIANVFEKKQAVANKLVADQANVAYTTGLTAAQSQLKDAYASGNSERIQEARQNYNTYDPNAQGFSFAAYQAEGSNVSDETFYTKNGYLNNAQLLWGRAENATRNYEPQYQITNTIKSLQNNASKSVHKASQQYLGQPMPQMVYEATLANIMAYGNSEAFGALSSKDARNTGLAQASNLTRQHLENNLRNARSENEVKWLLASVVDRYDDQLKFVTDADREKIFHAAERRRGQLTADGNKLLKAQNTASFKNAESTMINFVNNDAKDLVSLQNAAAQTNDVLMTVDREHLAPEQQAQYDSLSALSRMFIPTSVVVRNPDGSEEPIVTSLINQAVYTAIRNARGGQNLEFTIPEEFLSVLTKDHATQLLTLGNDIADTVFENLQQGNTSVLTMFTDKPEEIATLLNSLGYEDMPIVTESQETLSMYNLGEPNSVQAYLVDLSQKNTPEAMDALADTLYRSPVSTSDDLLRAHQIELVASGADSEQVAFVYSRMGVAAERYEPEQHTLISHIIADVDPEAITGSFAFTADATNSELLNQYNLAIQSNDTKRAEAMMTLYQGALVSVVDRVSATLGDVPLNLSDTKHLNMIKHQFFEQENELMLPSIGLRRKSADGVDVYIPPAVLNQINLEHRKPYTALVEGMPWYANAVRNATESETYQKIGSFVSRILKGTYTMLPQHFTERWLDVLVDEVVDSGFLQYDPTIVVKSKNFDPELQDLVEDYKLDTALAPEDLREVLKTTVSSGRGSKVPLFSFGRKARGQGIALMYYNRRIGDYSPVIGTDFNMISVSVPEAVDRLKEEGLYPRMDRYFRGVDDKNEVPQLPYTSEYFGN